VNPFATNAWVGKIQLYPGTDEWNENRVAPDVKVDAANGAYDSFKHFNDSELATGTVWNYWETNWFGTDRNNGTDTENITFGTSQSTSIRPTQNASSNELRTGTSVGLAPGTAEAYDASRSVEVNVVPYIRSRKIYFKASNLKPNTKYYAFFDGANVGKYIRQENVIPAYLLTYTGTSDALDPTYINRNDATFFQDYINYTQHPVGYTDLYSNDFGELVGSFVIPNNSEMKFRSGKRVFTLVDIGSGDKRLASSYADSSYDTRGQFLDRQSSVISTRPVEPAIQQIALGMTQQSIVVPPPPAPPQPTGKVVVIDTTTENPTYDDAAPTPQPIIPRAEIPASGTEVIADNIVCVFPPSSNVGVVTTPKTSVSVDVPPTTIQPPWRDSSVTTPEVPLNEARYGWYPIEAFEPYTTRSPYLVWSLPPQPRPTQVVQEEAVKKGWYPSEAVYGQQPGGLIYCYPPNPNQSFTGINTTNNTPVNTTDTTPNTTTTTDTTQESSTAVQIVGTAIANTNIPTGSGTILACIPPEQFKIEEIEPTLINYECWPGPLIDETTVSDLYYVSTDSEYAEYTPEPDYFMSYDDTTIYTDAGAQVSFESFEEEYMNAVEA
jgi:hypothetical protein